MAAGLVSPVARAAEVDDAVTELQRDWEVIRYQTPAAEREKRFEALAAKAHKVSEAYPGRAEPLVWEGIIVSSWAGEKGGLGALGLVKQAKALYEEAIAIDGNALDGSAYNSLGVLYYKVPGWPVGFGDKAKAKELLAEGAGDQSQGHRPQLLLRRVPGRDQATGSGRRLSRARIATRRPGPGGRWPTPVGARKRERCSTKVQGQVDCRAVSAALRRRSADEPTPWPSGLCRMSSSQAVQRGDAPRDRDAEAAAAFLLTVGAVEALAQACQLLAATAARRCVLDSELCPARNASVTVLPARRIANGVVEQVAQQHGEQVLVAQQRHGCVPAGGHSHDQFDAAAICQREAIVMTCSTIGCQCDIGERAARCRTRARDRASICVDQPAHAIDAGGQLGFGLRALGSARSSAAPRPIAHAGRPAACAARARHRP